MVTSGEPPGASDEAVRNCITLGLTGAERKTPGWTTGGAFQPGDGVFEPRLPTEPDRRFRARRDAAARGTVPLCRSRAQSLPRLATRGIAGQSGSRASAG